MKVYSQQIDIKWDRPEPFALAVQQTQDGDRIAADQAETQKASEQAERNQRGLELENYMLAKYPNVI